MKHQDLDNFFGCMKLLFTNCTVIAILTGEGQVVWKESEVINPGDSGSSIDQVILID